MPAQTSNLFLLQDLEDPSRMGTLAKRDLTALRSIAGWIKSFILKPNPDLGRGGPVCPYVHGATDSDTLWLAPEQIADRSPADVVKLVKEYEGLLLSNAGPGTDRAIIVVLTDVPAERAQEVLDDKKLQQLKAPSYLDDGIVLGEFHENNNVSALYNASFHPFKSPVPFILIRNAVISDWKFFLDNEDFLSTWAHRFGDSAVPALAGELRRTNWRRIEA